MILGELVLYKDSIINLEIRPIQVNIKGRSITVNFNILLLGTDKAVLKIILLFILFIVRCGSLIGPCRLYLLLQRKSSRAHLEAKTSRVYRKNAMPKANPK